MAAHGAARRAVGCVLPLHQGRARGRHGPRLHRLRRIVLGALVLVPIAVRWGASARCAGAGGAISFMAFVQVVVPFLLITYGERTSPSSLTGILVAAAPIFTALLAVRFDAGRAPARDRGGGRRAWGSSASCCCSASTSAATRRRSPAASWSCSRRSATRSAASTSSTACAACRRSAIAAATMVVGARAGARRRCSRCPSAPSLKAIGSLLALGAGGTGIAFSSSTRSSRPSARPRIARRVHRARLRRRLRRLAARRAADGGRRARARAHPRRLLARRRGPAAGQCAARANAPSIALQLDTRGRRALVSLVAQPRLTVAGVTARDGRGNWARTDRSIGIGSRRGAPLR